jgi:EAL domain-containing protein (putative c-di-GMP-specific phosphodiesterase class I)
MITREGIKLAESNLLKWTNIGVNFQPIVSLRQQRIIGYESLCRGTHKITGENIPPDYLFDYADKNDELLVLDRQCRTTSLSSFSNISGDEDSFLFLNIASSILNKSTVGSGALIEQVKNNNLSPGRIVIEIVESQVHDIEALQKFVETYRDYGFLIALDDVGAGHSNLDRITLIKPDFLKIDMSLIRDIDKEYYKRVVFKSVVSLATNIGALVVAEGIQTENELFTVMESGADFLQGYALWKPQKPEDIYKISSTASEKLCPLARKFAGYMVGEIRQLRSQSIYYSELSNYIVSKLCDNDDDDYEFLLQAMVDSFCNIECLYILNAQGIQITNTVMTGNSCILSAKSIFRPAISGASHAFKDYYYLLMNTDIERFTTEPYISLATGNLCVTIAAKFKGINGREYVLCIDIMPSS